MISYFVYICSTLVVLWSLEQCAILRHFFNHFIFTRDPIHAYVYLYGMCISYQDIMISFQIKQEDEKKMTNLPISHRMEANHFDVVVVVLSLTNVRIPKNILFTSSTKIGGFLRSLHTHNGA